MRENNTKKRNFFQNISSLNFTIFGIVFTIIFFLVGEVFSLKKTMLDYNRQFIEYEIQLKKLQIIVLNNEIEKLSIDIDRIKSKKFLNENDKKLLLILTLRQEQLKNLLKEVEKT